MNTQTMATLAAMVVLVIVYMMRRRARLAKED
jgi:hypothetical protein